MKDHMAVIASPAPCLESLPTLGTLLDDSSSPACSIGSSSSSSNGNGSSSSSTSGMLNGIMPIGSHSHNNHSTMNGSVVTSNGVIGGNIPNGSSPPATNGIHTNGVSNGSHHLLSNGSLKCAACRDTYTLPRVLPCLHTFCQPCLERAQDTPDHLFCPQCRHDCPLPPQGVSGLMLDYAISSLLDAAALEQGGGISGFSSGAANNIPCTGCKSRDSCAVARCFDCANFLCGHCVMAHQFMHCFEGHHVITFGELQNSKENGKSLSGIGLNALLKASWCPRHKGEPLQQYCKSCQVPACRECAAADHCKPPHELDSIEQATPNLMEHLSKLERQLDGARVRVHELRQASKSAEAAATLTQLQVQEVDRDIQEAFQMFHTALEERRQELSRELEAAASARQLSLTVGAQRALEYADRLQSVFQFGEKLVRHSTPVEVMLTKKLIEMRLTSLLTPGGGCGVDTIASLVAPANLEFVSNIPAINSAVRTTFGFLRTGDGHPIKQPPIARPQSASSHHSPHMNGNSIPMINSSGNSLLERALHNYSSSSNGHVSPYETGLLTKRFPYPSSTINDLANLNGLHSNYEKWSVGDSNVFQNVAEHLVGVGGDSVADLASKILMTPLFPPKSQLKRQKMIYHCKFGEFGVLEGQFTEPSGVAVNAQNDIIVADTNNHRIQVFDREGRFNFHFGECGKRDGQLLYPNRVSVVKPSGDIVVTERSPTHQIQIYNQYGQFVRKFGANILQHPRGVTVDNKGRIIVVECKVMRVIIFDQMGNVLQKFGCSKHLEFPNGVVVNDRQEIFISDNRAHCVKVFSYDGVFLRQIGGEGLTNYPIGVGINAAGEILIADNHNNFNLTIFTQEGQLVAAMESKVKHAQCFDVALMDDGSVVLASKDYRLYVYRYAQVTPVNL